MPVTIAFFNYRTRLVEATRSSNLYPEKSVCLIFGTDCLPIWKFQEWANVTVTYFISPFILIFNILLI